MQHQHANPLHNEPQPAQQEAPGADVAVAGNAFAQLQLEDDRAPFPARDFDSALNVGARAIASAEVAAQTQGGTLFGGLTEDSAQEQPVFDQNIWAREHVEGEDDGSDSDAELEFQLVLQQGLTPSQAVFSFFEKLEEYKFDCAEALQFVRWYAHLMAMGSEGFDQAVGDGEFALRAHDSTGLGGGEVSARVDQDGYYTQTEPLEQTADEAGVGSRVMWRNWHEDAEDTDFENENALKIGDDSYFAHPMGITSSEDLRRDLAVEAGVDGDARTALDAYLQQWVSVAEIESFRADFS
jgi:hypothetical protein